MSPGNNQDTPSLQIPLEQRVQAELVRTAYEDSLYGAVVGAFVVLIYGYVMMAAAPVSIVMLWMSVAFSCNLLRFINRSLFFRQARRIDHLRRWTWSYVAVSGLTGLSWGAAGWMFFSVESFGYRLLTVLVLAGLTTGAARLLAPIFTANVAYFLCSIVPLMAAFFMIEALRSPALAVMCVAYIGYTIVAARQQLRSLQRSIRLGYENGALVESLGRAKDSADQLNRGLSAEIARRQVIETELREASAKAESANRAKSEFLATMSHEIRTPMNGILGMLRIVRDTPLTPEQREQLDTAAHSADTLLELINDILDLSKIEAGRLDLEQIAFAPEPTVRSVIDLLQPRARAKAIALVLDYDATIPGALIGDPTRLRQVLFNLLGNAIKFTEQGSVTLRVNRLPTDNSATGDKLSFAVMDTGIGLDEETMSRLFQAFSQADSSMSRRFGGTGLGLTISQKLAEGMGGKITVQSVPGAGATFTFSIPFRTADAQESSRLQAEASSGHCAIPKLSGRVLVVEDDRVNQRVITHFLNQLGLETSLAKDGFEAVQAATTAPWDAILMDCQLPGLDGLEATRRIRAKLPGHALPIIALTANASTQDRAACLACGMDDFLTKPIRMENLSEALTKWLGTPTPHRG
ncbi:MAG: response regulator [Cephaloticoccus sp.]|nr:response regulator [Cephaloticoccus sp.]MCF7759868.1 response regulator [Cephaloticoccus sp.]